MNTYLGYFCKFPTKYSFNKYSAAITEIHHYLQAQIQTDSLIKVIQNQCIINLKLGANSLSILKNPRFLHPVSYHLQINSEDDFEFVKLCYECLMILKQYSPSQLQIELNAFLDDALSDKQLQISSFPIQNKDRYYLLVQKIKDYEMQQKSQLARRIHTNFKLLLEEKRKLNNSDLEDLFYVMDREQQFSQKCIVLAIKILKNNKLQESITITASEKSILQKYLVIPQLKKMVIEVLQKFNERQTKQNQIVLKSYPTFTCEKQPSQDKTFQNLSESSKQRTVSKYTHSTHIKSVLFQLKQSNNLERICFLLQKLIKQETDQKYFNKVDKILLQIAEKIASDYYAFHSKQNKASLRQFQFQFVKLYFIYLKNREIPFPQYLQQKLINRLEKYYLREQILGELFERSQADQNNQDFSNIQLN